MAVETPTIQRNKIIPDRARTWIWRAALVYSVVAVIADVIHYNRYYWLTGRSQRALSDDVIKSDADVFGIIRNLHCHTSLWSTLDWWHGNWVGPFEYWRPVSSLIFWTEYHLFGPERQGLWQVVEVLSHLAVVVLLGLVVYRLTHTRTAAWVAVILFAGYGPFWPINILSSLARYILSAGRDIPVARWKDGPDCWGAALTLLAMLLAERGRWSAAIACVAIGVGVKDSLWMAFPLLLIAALYHRRLRSIPKAAWLGGVGTIVALLYLRWISGPAVFFGAHVHSNRYGVVRFINTILSGNLAGLQTPEWPIPILGFWLAWWIVTTRFRLAARLIAALAGFAILGGLVDYSLSHDWLSDIASLIDPTENLPWLVFATGYALVIVLALRDPETRRLAFYLLSAVLLTALPIIAVVQVDVHMLYTVDVFRSALTAVLLTAAGRHVIRALPRPIAGARVSV